MTYRVRNWASFQHYKHRDPPWIKLHFSLLSSRDWVVLDDASRALAIACMLIASRNKGEVPDDPEYLRRVAFLSSVNFKPLIECGFLEDASICTQLRTNAMPEKSRVEESRAEQSASAASVKHEPPTLAALQIEETVPAAILSACLTANGIPAAPANPTIRAWADAGFTVANLQAAIVTARERKPPPEKIPLAYLDPILRSPPKSTGKYGSAWMHDEGECERVARELGCWPARKTEGWHELRNRMREAMRA